MLGKSHTYMNCLQIHGLSLQASGRRQLATSLLLTREPRPQAESSRAEWMRRQVLKHWEDPEGSGGEGGGRGNRDREYMYIHG